MEEKKIYEGYRHEVCTPNREQTNSNDRAYQYFELAVSRRALSEVFNRALFAARRVAAVFHATGAR
jgi:hypothetical protein